MKVTQLLENLPEVTVKPTTVAPKSVCFKSKFSLLHQCTFM